MRKKISFMLFSLLLVFTTVFTSLVSAEKSNSPEFSTESNSSVKGEVDENYNFNTARNNGKVIVVDISRTNLDNMLKFKTLDKKLRSSGYIGLMNIRGDKGYDDRRNYATFGSTGRVNVSSEENIDFLDINDENIEIYEARTAQKPKKFNLANINQIDLYNQSYGEFKSKFGHLAEVLDSSGKKIYALGNSDYLDEEGNLVENKNFLLGLMDSKGRVDDGVVGEEINKKDLSLPFGISTDYKKLKEFTSEGYEKSDLIFVNLGDTYRLDTYKDKLNNKTFYKMKNKIYNNINNYLEYVFDLAGENDTIYIIGGFPSNIDYKNNRRFSPVLRFDLGDDTKGLLKSATTRRDGIVANLDLGVDILSRFGLKDKEMVGRVMTEVKREDNISFIQRDYKKIVAISTIRISIINFYVTIIVLSWIIGALALWKRNKISKKYRQNILDILKELIKFGLIMPLAFLTAPITMVNTGFGVAMSIIAMSVIYYLVSRLIFKKDDLKQLGFYAIVMIGIIVLDSVLGTPLMKSNIMSYDPMIGARYYGIGNEYEGVTIGSAIFGISVLLQYKKIPRVSAIPILIVVLITSAYPAMGANVGGAISECIAYIVFVLLLFDVRIDIKKVIYIGVATVLLVAAFAFFDIFLQTGSHLANFVEQIRVNGPMEILFVFTRKIEMNIQLAQTTVWVNILLAGLAILAVIIFRPNKDFSDIKNTHNIVYKGFLSTMVGCIVTMLVNDSGIIAAATDSIYLLIPILIIMMNKKTGSEENFKIKK